MDYNWIVQILRDNQNFPMVFQVFPKNVESGAAPRSDNGTSNLMILLVKISSGRKS